MTKRLMSVFVGILLFGLVLGSSGCVALLAGAGATALWQGGKVISEENVPMAKAVTAAENAFKVKKITLTERVIKTAATQLRGEDALNERVAVDIIRKGENYVRIEIRYGLGQETPARELLGEIKGNLQGWF